MIALKRFYDGQPMNDQAVVVESVWSVGQSVADERLPEEVLAGWMLLLDA